MGSRPASWRFGLAPEGRRRHLGTFPNQETFMAVTVFAAPILPGRTDAWKAAVAEMKGPRREERDASHRRLGITREVVALQQTPEGDFAVVFIEGEDPEHVIGKYFASDHPFERWFTETVLVGTHGMSPDQDPPPPNEVVYDWSA